MILTSSNKYVSLNSILILFTGLIVVTSFTPKAVKEVVNAVSGGVSTSTDGQIQGNSFAGVELSSEQIENANQIIATGKGMGMSDKDIVTALMTAMQESTMENLNHGDDWFFAQWGEKSDSRGLFQQRDSWGSQECRMTPSCSAKLFFEALQQISDRESMSNNDVAADVQRPAEQYRGHYAQHEPMAEALLKAWKPNNDGFSIDAATTKVETNDDNKNPSASVTCVKKTVEGGLLCGSGVAISSDLILTNHHMLGDNIVVFNGQDIKATVIKEDAALDLALLKVEGANFTPIEFSESDVTQGQSVTALGFPGGGSSLVTTQGTITGINQACRISQEKSCMRLSSGLVAPGNSGGAIVDDKGHLIGLTDAMQEATGIGSAIQMEVVRAFVGVE